MDNRNFRDYYILGEKLGEGGFGTVYKATIKGTKEQRALKITDKKKIKEQLSRELFRIPTEEDLYPYTSCFDNEVKNMKMMEGYNRENENTVKYYDHFDTENEFVIVMELCDDNLMNVFIKRNTQKNPFNVEDIYEILSQLNYSFRMMVAKQLVHRDLKLENILVKYENKERTKFTLKLTDYGLSKQLLTLSKRFSTKIGTYNFMAPEILRENPVYNQECDLWSLGVIIFILIFKRYPYDGANEGAVLNKINSFGNKIIKDTNNEDLNDLIKSLLNIDPSKRLSWEKYFNHPFFIKRDFRNYYDIIKEIGQGAYGQVYCLKHKKNNQKRAIKLISKSKIIEDFKREKLQEPTEEDIKPYIESLYREIENMQIVEGKNKENKYTVKFYEYFETDIEFGIVMELCDDNLFNILSKNALSIPNILYILKQLNTTLKIMISKNLIHRDLKLENILVKYENNEKTQFTIKLTDYGASKQLLNMKKKFSTKIGTCNYMAPEILNGEHYGKECDLWSLGIIIYILFFRQYPFGGDTDMAVKNNINNFGLSAIKKTHNKYLDDLLRRLLVKSPQERLKWNDYFEHPFFKKSIKEIMEANEVIKNSQIIIKLNIGDSDKKNNEYKKIYFIGKNYFIQNNKEMKYDRENEELKNLNETNTILYINDKKQNFQNYFIPNQNGDYVIKIIFNKKLNDCSYMFRGCYNITNIDLSSFDSSNITNMKYMFGKCTNLETVNLNNLNTQKVTDISYMFNSCSSLKKIEFPNSFNTENVNNMEYMFHNCDQITEIIFNSSFKTKNVTNMMGMFKKCNNLGFIDISNFNTEKVNNMGYMFDQCINLEKITLDPTIFKTKQVFEMGHMFNECTKLKKIDLSSFTGETIKSVPFMFAFCEEFKDINLSKFNANENVNMINMFNGCSNLQTLDLSSFKIANKENTSNMFDELTNIKKIKVNQNSIDNCKNFFLEIDEKFSLN